MNSSLQVSVHVFEDQVQISVIVRSMDIEQLNNVAEFLLEQKFGYIPTSDMLMYHHRARLRDVLGFSFIFRT